MRIPALLVITGVAFVLAGCAKKHDADDPKAAMESAPAAVTGSASSADESDDVMYPGGPLIQHMHMHAAQLEKLNAALEAGNLEAAGTPAYWLSRHKNMTGVPDNWRPHIVTMRMAAEAVEAAPDLDSARAAADRVADSCRGCHEATGGGPS